MLGGRVGDIVGVEGKEWVFVLKVNVFIMFCVIRVKLKVKIE